MVSTDPSVYIHRCVVTLNVGQFAEAIKCRGVPMLTNGTHLGQNGPAGLQYQLRPWQMLTKVARLTTGCAMGSRPRIDLTYC